MEPLKSLPEVCPVCAAVVTSTDRVCARCGASLGSGSVPGGEIGEADRAGPADPHFHARQAAVPGVGPSTARSPADGFTATSHGIPVPGPTIETPPPGMATQTSWQSASPSDSGDLLHAGQAFGSRYHIIKLLGVGGMGAVYQAWDDELGVAVAIKTIRPGAGTDPTSAHDAERRFKRELVLARQITHPNVVRIHDLGEIGGIKYITMPFVNGSTLGDVMAREGRLPVSRALGIFRQVVSGMRAAHEKDVVHRDLKPANIMIEDGVAYIMDFGIARQVESGATMTYAGAVVGTLDYMAPEQAEGKKVDQRADVYALGLILQDMIVGRSARPKTDNPLSDLMRRLAAPPPPVRTVVPDVPEPVERIITRCLQVDPAARFQTSADLQAALAELDDSGNLKPATASMASVPALPARSPRSAWLVRAAVALVVVAVGTGAWFAARRTVAPAAAVSRPPVSVLIADFKNGLGDAAFDHALEPVLKLALEGADFISAYDRLGIARSLGVRPPEVLDERAALEIAVKQGVGVVLSGDLARQGGRYAVSVKATRAVTGDVLATATETAGTRDEVLGVVTTLAARVRQALGDDTSDSAQRFAMDTLSATSIEVVREYAAAMDALSRSRFEEARQGFARAVEQEPTFGLAYAGLAIASRNLDNHQDAEKWVKEAVRHLDGMTERERYRTRGLYYYLTSDYQACVKEYGDLIARFSADAAARNNLALCLTYLREMPRAVEEMRQVVAILPNRALYRENLALYAAYSGDFPAAEQEVRSMPQPGPFGLLALAFAQLGKGQLAEAAETYRTLEKDAEVGASYAASGLGDLAVYEGRFADAARILEAGAAADLAARDAERAASKFNALAEVRAIQGNTAAARAAADRALANSQAAKVRLMAARVFVETGALDKARAIASELAAELPAEPRAYARMVEGLIALEEGDPRQAVRLLSEANGLLDTWIGHLELGRAYLELGAFTQADSEFDRCLKRRGEALALFLDEEPTYGRFPPVYYYQGRAREGLNSTGYADSYRAYLAIRGTSPDDPLVPEARARAGQ
jgi:tetratricopeptide (TPR) repeat protein